MQLNSLARVLAVILSLSLFIAAASATFCRYPPSISNGRHNAGSRRNFRIGHVVTYSCNNGYKLNGYRSITCIRRSNYVWNRNPPKCVRILTRSSCRKPPSISNGIIKGSNYRTGSYIKYICNRGYTLNGNVYRKCLSSGWTGKSPKCIGRRQCPSLKNPQNGRVKFTEGRGVGAKVWYICNYGFTLVGSESRRCKSDLTWSPAAPLCKARGCGKPEKVNNGRVSFDRTSVGSKAIYACNEGYTLKGSNRRVCQISGDWTPKVPSCQRVDCGRLDNPNKGSVSLSRTDFGSIATYKCNEGYELIGNRNRRCQSNKQWSGKKPTCRKITCDRLRDIPQGRVSFTSSVLVPGTRATYTCVDGYELVGDKARTCQENREWSGREPQCRRITCDRLRDIPQGRVSFSSSVLVPGTRATYTCVDGYELVGDKARTCQENREWSGREPQCRRITCDRLRDIPQGRVSLSSSVLVPGTRATYTCVDGYELVGDKARTCQENGEWSGREPRCRRITCDRLRDIPQGRVSFSSSVLVPGTRATYTCVDGYELVGDKARTCQENREWSGREPQCRRVVFDCGPLFDPENGEVDTRSGTKEGDVATYSCFRGYTIKGVTSRTCTGDGWSDNEPTCEIIDCGPLSDPVFGNVQFFATIYRSIAIYQCFRGYVIDGVTTRTCQVDGNWSDVAPSCIPFDCGPLEDPPNGLVSFTTTTFRSLATYTCNPTYFLNGQSERRCQSTGWSGEAPQCFPITCPPLASPTNGNVEVPSRRVGSVAIYSCNSGYSLDGLERRTCQSDGQWLGIEPKCIQDIIDCGELANPFMGVVETTGTSVGSSAVYSCISGYRLDGVDTRICQPDSQWSNTAPTCTRIECEQLEAIPNGDVELSGIVVGSIARYSCIEGYDLSNDQQRECQDNGQWSGNEPQCILVDCGTLPAPDNGNIEFISDGQTTFRSRVSYTCNQGYFLQGPETRTCQGDGTWSDSEPECVIIVQCPRLFNPTNGLVTVGGRRPGNTAFYECDSGYILTGGDERRTCQTNGVWSGEEPTCPPVDCGDLEDPDNGNVQVMETTLGSGAKYSCNLGFQLRGVQVRICVESGDWSDDAPVCVVDTCPSLSNPENGLVNVSGEVLGSTATYTCNNGYVLSGADLRFCLLGGVWSENDPTCIIPQAGCGDPGTPVNGRRIGSDFSFGSVVFFRCFDDYDLVGSKYRECRRDGTWSGIQPTCTPFISTCEGGANQYDRCGRRCKCVNGRLVECCRVRRDYAGLSVEDRLEFINTYLKIVSDPIYRPRYTALLDTYTRSFSNGITHVATPSVSQFFPFNRYFLLEFEDMMKDFNCSLTIPFYDWTPFPLTPYTAAVWGNADGFGDSARLLDQCVITGPFRVGEYSLTPSAGGGCLMRLYTNQKFPSRDIVERDLLTHPSTAFSGFHRFLHLFIGVNVQCFIGGTICSTNATNDPIYLLHIAQLDSILMRWQSIGGGRNTVRYSDDNSLLREAPGFTVKQFSDNFNLPYSTCLTYDPPVLLKNHAAPSSLQTLGTRAQIRTMDCIHTDMMDFVGMNHEDHAFMKKQCEKMRVFRSIRDVPTKNN